MMRLKRFSSNKILNTNMGVGIGFTRGRKYDTDMDRLGRMTTSHRELSKVGELNREMRKLNTELNQGRLGKWHDTD
jgi:hypothetical protein